MLDKVKNVSATTCREEGKLFIAINSKYLANNKRIFFLLYCKLPGKHLHIKNIVLQQKTADSKKLPRIKIEMEG